jgi:hypothetical protein
VVRGVRNLLFIDILIYNIVCSLCKVLSSVAHKPTDFVQIYCENFTVSH